jgi:hypothetical protein
MRPIDCRWENEAFVPGCQERHFLFRAGVLATTTKSLMSQVKGGF